jgi:two-component system, OmpR family, response regulator
MKILLVEDDRKLAQFLTRALEEETHVVDTCRSGSDAIEQASSIAYDVVVLDWMLPERDGLSVCRELRRRGNVVRILMLTARAEVGERVAALDAGADDFVQKPFHLGELLARIRALSRRASNLPMETLRIGPIAVSLYERVAHVDGVRLELTAREFSLLAVLVCNAGRIVTRSEMLSQVWHTHSDPGSNVIEVHIRNLREKLGSAAAQLETVRGHGYRLALLSSI